MNIAFSTDWFLTVPGMLITCGVILLLIALIMFVVSLSKGNKKTEVNNAQVPVNPQPAPAASVEPMIAPVESVTPVAPVSDVAVSQPMGPIEGVSAPSTPIIPEVPVVSAPEVVEPVAPVMDVNVPEVPVVPEIVTTVEEVIPVVEVPEVVSVEPQIEQPVAPVQPVIPEIAPIPEIVPTEIIPEVEDVVLETPEATNLEATSVNIYGGAVPTVEVSSVKPQEEARVIYGGADPLEATQNLPKVDVHHEPYSGGNIPVEPVMPVVPEVTPIPEVAPVVVETPAVVNEQPQQPVIPTPSVIEIPDVEQL